MKRVLVFIACLMPFAWLVYCLATGMLGPDPAEGIMHITGEWAVRFLLITLLVSPLRKWFSWNWLQSYRRMLGLYAFFYAFVHLLTFGHFYVGWTFALLGEELLERPYITAGFTAWLILLALAITSTNGWRRRLKRKWSTLHSAVYVAAIAVVAHILWQARSDIGEPLLYGVLFGGLLLWRLKRFRDRRVKA